VPKPITICGEWGSTARIAPQTAQIEASVDGDLITLTLVE
jgi:hypothetical protein